VLNEIPPLLKKNRGILTKNLLASLLSEMIRIEVQEFVLQKKKKGFQNFEIEM
jgi:hypothetical protein